MERNPPSGSDPVARATPHGPRRKALDGRVPNLVARKRVTDSATPDPPARQGTQCLPCAFPRSSSPSPMGLFDISVSHSVCKQLFIPDSQGPGEHQTAQEQIIEKFMVGIIPGDNNCFFPFKIGASLGSTGCSKTHSLDEPGLELRDPPASAS